MITCHYADALGIIKQALVNSAYFSTNTYIVMVHWDCSFEYPKCMLKLLGNKIFTTFMRKKFAYLIEVEIKKSADNKPRKELNPSLTGGIFHPVWYNKFSIIGPVKQKNSVLICDYFLIHQFKQVFWVLKRTVSLRRFFWVPTTYVLVENLRK